MRRNAVKDGENEPMPRQAWNDRLGRHVFRHLLSGARSRNKDATHGRALKAF